MCVVKFTGIDDLTEYFLTNSNEGLVHTNQRVARFTSWRCGGKADFFCDVYSITGLRHIIKTASEHNISVKILGFGTNILVHDERVAGVVIRLMGDPFMKLERIDDVSVRVGSRVSLAKLIKTCADRGLSGCESLAGIPGSVGGAIAQNAGAFGQSIGDCVEHITVMDTSGALKTIKKKEGLFSYRKGPEEIIIDAKLSFKNMKPAIIHETINTILLQRDKKFPHGHTAGCVFKNPSGYSAGALIDAVGLKGTKQGTALISPVHANFIITADNPSSNDVNRLIEIIHKTVKEKKGIDLELEIEKWG